MSRKEKKRKRSEEDSKIKFKWKTEFGDHFSSPRQAFVDIYLALEYFSKCLGKKKETLKILDPFYCDGSCLTYLHDLGFMSAENPCEDFYQSTAFKTNLKHFDVLVTNPPYSADHKQRALTFALKTKKPWAMLLPAYCCEKDYFPGWESCFVLVPKFHNYIFRHPLGVSKKEKIHDKEPSLPTFLWIISPGQSLPGGIDALVNYFEQKLDGHNFNFVLCRTLSQLVTTRAIRGTKRPNPRQRRRKKELKTTSSHPQNTVPSSTTAATAAPAPSSSFSFGAATKKRRKKIIHT
mmetsp:Transcript_3414/g.4781  ORF Transcript_3414/g.4781 Transcript_3414/m.4781 type:complete len:292 (+) Transcript_3414:60-935(+)